MRRASIGLAIVVAIGLVWSVAAMTKLVPLHSAEINSAATSPRPSTVGQGENPRQGFRDAGRSGVGMRAVARRFRVSLGAVKQACTAPRSTATTTKDLG